MAASSNVRATEVGADDDDDDDDAMGPATDAVAPNAPSPAPLGAEGVVGVPGADEREYAEAMAGEIGGGPLLA